MNIDFKPELFNKKYIPLLHCKKRYVFLMGGGGSGKSKFQAQKEIIKTFQKGNRLLSVRKVKDTMKDSVFAELVGVINDWKLQSYFTITVSPLRIINNLSNSDIIFRGLDDVEKIKSVQGVTRVWLEEATEADKKDFDQLDIRLRGQGKELQLTCTYNPISDQHWLITDFWNYGSNHDIECLHSTYKDNRFVGHEQYDKVFDRLKKTNLNLYNIYALGIPGKAVEGLVFEYKTINNLPTEAKLLGYGLDFGFNHPACMVGIYEWNGGVIIDEVFHKSGMTNTDILNFLKQNNIDKYTEILGDSSRPEAIEEIYRGGFNCKPCSKGKDSVMNGIGVMKSMDLYITAKSGGVKKDFDNYVWSKDKNGNALETPVKLFDDGPDAARYGIIHFFGKKIEFDIEIG